MDRYVFKPFGEFFEHGKALLRGKKIGLAGVVRHHDIQLVEQLAPPLYYIEMPVRRWIECSWKNCGYHKPAEFIIFDGLQQVMYYCSMKISKFARKTFVFSASFFALSLFLGCHRKSNIGDEVPAEEPVPAVSVEVTEVQKPAPAEKKPEPVKEASAPKKEPVVEESPAPFVEEAPVVESEPVVEAAEADDEYSRSVGSVGVSRDVFVDDKEKVLKIIERLDGIMKDMNYRDWLTYVDDESIQYWSRPVNLKNAEKRLPGKGLIKLRDLNDFFKWLFVPARRGREVTEIRYISDKYIKAVQVQEDQDIVYYYFNKVNGHWMVHIPPVEN